MRARALVVAKAPVPGRAKTRLGAAIGMEAAAQVAASALLDTIEACRLAFEDCAIALEGDLEDAVAGGEIAGALSGWQVFAQVGETFGDRLVHAHRTAAASGTVVVQIGMDTPQVSAAALRELAEAVLDPADAVLGPAEDGGWWVFAVADPGLAGVLAHVPMSAPETYRTTLAALLAAGARVKIASPLTDVDTAEDADRVAASAPATRFAQTWTATTAVAS